MKIASMVMVLVLGGCEHAASPLAGVSAYVADSHLTIGNNSPFVTYYAVFERQSLAYTDWLAVCRSDNAIEPFSAVRIQIADSSYLPSNEAVVYWWHQGKKYAGTDMYGADELRSIVVRIR